MRLGTPWTSTLILTCERSEHGLVEVVQMVASVRRRKVRAPQGMMLDNVQRG